MNKETTTRLKSIKTDVLEYMVDSCNCSAILCSDCPYEDICVKGLSCEGKDSAMYKGFSEELSLRSKS